MTEGTGRLEAFSDGVFAIACTLLILEVRLPPSEENGDLWSALLALWPHYLAFALSFFVILVTWITHHDLMRLVQTTTRSVQLANGFVLLCVTFVPFPTAVLADRLGGPDMSLAVAFYSGTFLLGSGAFNLLVATIMRGKCHRPESAQMLVEVRRGVQIIFVVYLAATAIALVAPWAALGINVAVRLHLLRARYEPAIVSARANQGSVS